MKFDSTGDYDANELFEGLTKNSLARLESVWEQYFEGPIGEPFSKAVLEPVCDDYSDEAINDYFQLMEAMPKQGPLIYMYIICSMLLRAKELGASAVGWRVLSMAIGFLSYAEGNLDSKQKDLDAFEPIAHRAAISKKNAHAAQAPRPSRRTDAVPGEIKAGAIEAVGLKLMVRDSSPEPSKGCL